MCKNSAFDKIFKYAFKSLILFACIYFSGAGPAHTSISLKLTAPVCCEKNTAMGSIILEGVVATEVIHSSLLKKIESIYPLYTIEDLLRVGDASDSEAQLYFVSLVLGRLIDGVIILNNNTISITGKGDEGWLSMSNAQLPVDLQSKVPPGLSVALNVDGVLTVTWNIKKYGQTIVINGSAPTVTDQNLIRADVFKQFPDAMVTDQSIVLARDEPNFYKAAKASLNQIEVPEAAMASITGNNYSMTAAFQKDDATINNNDLSDAYKKMARLELPKDYKVNNIDILNSSPESVDDRSVSIYFATDRNNDSGELLPSFGASRSDSLTYGIANIHVPEDHKVGRIEIPNELSLYFFTIKATEDPKKHFIIKKFALLDKDSWVNLIKQQTVKGDILVIVHGYNTSFKDATLLAAQMTWDLQWKGPTILFSWPSMGNVASYEYDRNSALVSRTHFLQLLELLQDKINNSKIDILSHSMGNLISVDGLAFGVGKGIISPISNLIMAAPDIDRDQFKQDIPLILSAVRRMTLYASSADRAILASRTFAQSPRAGDVIDGIPTIVAGVESIDVTAIGDNILSTNHSEFATNREVIDDISLLLKGMEPPNTRLPQIRGVPSNSTTPQFWRYMP